MEGVVFGVLLILAFAVLFAFWPFWLLLLVIYLIRRHNKKIKLEQQKEAERIQATKQTISSFYNSFFQTKAIRFNELMSYIDRLNDEDKTIARSELLPYEERICIEIGKNIRPRIDKSQIEDGFALLDFMQIDYTSFQNAVSAVIDLAEDYKCYLLSNNYGVANQNVIDEISNYPVENCIYHLGLVDIRFSLWKFVIQEPFDYASYMVISNALNNFNMSYGKKSIDIILSGAYLAKRYGEEYAYSIYPEWKDDLNEYIKPTYYSDTSYMVYELASALSYFGCYQLELNCLRQLYRQNNEYLKAELRERYIKLQNEYD